MSKSLVPGVGISPLEVKDADRATMVSRNGLNTAAQDLMNYSKSHTNIVPGTPEYNYGVGKSMALQQQVREGLLGTVFRESEKPLLEKFVNDNLSRRI